MEYIIKNLGGFENILESIVNFLSIVIGFYSAFYGIIISMYESRFMQKLLKSQYRDELPLLLLLSLISAFVCLILTIVMQSLIFYNLKITNWIYYICFFRWYVYNVCISNLFIVNCYDIWK